MLKVDPNARPTCVKLLNISLMKKVAHKLDQSDNSTGTIPTKAELMKTIKSPRNLKVKYLPLSI